MRLTTVAESTLLLLLTAASPAAADWLEIVYYCKDGWCRNYSGNWITSSAVWTNRNFDEGCRNPGVPYVSWACYDWTNLRGHFDQVGNPNKRCFRTRGTTINEQNGWYRTFWDEVGCSWRLAAETNVPVNATEEAVVEKRALPAGAKFRTEE